MGMTMMEHQAVILTLLMVPLDQRVIWMTLEEAQLLIQIMMEEKIQALEKVHPLLTQMILLREKVHLLIQMILPQEKDQGLTT